MADIRITKIQGRVFPPSMMKNIQSFIFISNTIWLLAEAKKPSIAYNSYVHITFIPLTSPYKSILKTLKISSTSIYSGLLCCDINTNARQVKKSTIIFSSHFSSSPVFSKRLTHICHLTHENSNTVVTGELSARSARSLGNYQKALKKHSKKQLICTVIQNIPGHNSLSHGTQQEHQEKHKCTGVSTRWKVNPVSTIG